MCLNMPSKLGKGFSRVVLVVLVPSRPVAEMKHLPVRDSFVPKRVLPPSEIGLALACPSGF